MNAAHVVRPSSLNDQSPSFVVQLTPSGRGAVAVVFVAGPAAVPTIEQCFTPAAAASISAAPIGRIVVGRWGGPDGEEIVVCRRSDEFVELHCHGGIAAVEAVVERFVREGCRRTSWQEWMRATEADPIRAAARIALADAPTTRTAAILLDQYHGALSSAVQNIWRAVAEGDWWRARELLAAVLELSAIGRHLTMPWRVVLTGLPNVGKSSLLNALAGYQRAIVSHVPGTTRDVVTVSTAIDGWPVELADTAGVGPSSDPLEAAGIALAESAVATADLVVRIHDASDSTYGRSAADDSALPPKLKLSLTVRNKIDLAPDARRGVLEQGAIATSAVTGEGVAELVAAIGTALVPQAPARGSAVPFTSAQADALRSAGNAVDRYDAAAALSALHSLLER